MDNESSFERHKRSVGDIGIGQLCDPDAKRDAIHFACAPVEAGQVLGPACSVTVRDGKAYLAENGIGIVDPFLRTTVGIGERFWLILNPGSITALRHAWEHPAFEAEKPAPSQPLLDRAASEQWLRDFCARADCPDYHTTVAAAINFYDDYGQSYNEGDYVLICGSDAHSDIPPEFWTHVQVVTGQTIPDEKRAKYFSCSC